MRTPDFRATFEVEKPLGLVSGLVRLEAVRIAQYQGSDAG